MSLPESQDYRLLSPYDRRVLREEYMAAQDNCCYFCGEQLDTPVHKIVAEAPINRELFPEGFFRWPVHLDHDFAAGTMFKAIFFNH